MKKLPFSLLSSNELFTTSSRINEACKLSKNRAYQPARQALFYTNAGWISLIALDAVFLLIGWLSV